MSRNVKIKEIKRLASKMPPMFQPKMVSEIMSGKQLIAEGHKVINGEKVKANATYDVFRKKMIQVDHAKVMIEIYDKEGPTGVRNYITAVDIRQKQLEDQEARTKAINL